MLSKFDISLVFQISGVATTSHCRSLQSVTSVEFLQITATVYCCWLAGNAIMLEVVSTLSSLHICIYVVMHGRSVSSMARLISIYQMNIISNTCTTNDTRGRQGHKDDLRTHLKKCVNSLFRLARGDKKKKKNQLRNNKKQKHEPLNHNVTGPPVWPVLF